MADQASAPFDEEEAKILAESIVLDASAVIALINEEPGADVVDAALDDAVISAVNLSEVIAVLIDAGFELERAQAMVSPDRTAGARVRRAAGPARGRAARDQAGSRTVAGRSGVPVLGRTAQRSGSDRRPTLGDA
jgi:hypothetical protein